jgi:succinoglycan biosynthesis protein ExoM
MARTRSPGVSVVIPTWNRPDGLGLALDGLRHQALDVDWDVVVVASAADPGAHRVVGAVDDLEAPGLVDVRVVDEPHSGASNARNRGLTESRQVVAFLDDDCRPEPGWLAAITAPVSSGQHTGSGGRVVLDRRVVPPRWLGDALLAFLAEYDRGPVARTLEPDDYLLTANAAFDADRLTAAGGFDPRLGPNAGQPMVDDDVDICRKVWKAGGTIGYVADAVVIHQLTSARLTPAYMLRRMHAQGRSDWRLERDSLRARLAGGAGDAGRQLWVEQRSILRQGPWHSSVAFHSAGSFARAAGFAREALASGRPGRRGGGRP